LKLTAEIRDEIDQLGQITDKIVVIEVTNLSDRTANVTSVGWVAGKRKKQVYGSQVPALRESDSTPFLLAYGEAKAVLVSLGVAPYWPGYMANQFLASFSISQFKTLRAVAMTSVGQVTYAKPSRRILDTLLEARKVPAVSVAHINQPPREDGSMFGM
jgi:hypothetical protein